MGYSIFTHCSFDKSKSKLNYCRGEDCMSKFCKDLREHATKIINYEKKDMIPLTKKDEKNYNNQKVCYICKKEFDKSDKKNYKVKDHCHYTGKYRGAAHNICNLRDKIPKEIPIVFHNGSTYDYHFIINPILHDLLIIGDKKIFVVIYDFKVITKNVCIEIFVVAFSIWGFWSLLL